MPSIDVATIYEMIFLVGGVIGTVPLIIVTLYTLNNTNESPTNALLYGTLTTYILTSSVILAVGISLQSESILAISIFIPVTLGVSYFISTNLFNLDGAESVRNIIQLWPIVNLGVGVFQVTIISTSTIILSHGTLINIAIYTAILCTIAVIIAFINQNILSVRVENREQSIQS